jgi:hypothetical protein
MLHPAYFLVSYPIRSQNRHRNDPDGPTEREAPSDILSIHRENYDSQGKRVTLILWGEKTLEM